MGLTVQSIMNGLKKVGFGVAVKHPLELVMVMGPNALYFEACYNQGINPFTGQYFECIIFNLAHFRGIESNWTQRVMFHELGHATGRHGRLERSSIDFRHRGLVSERLKMIEELIAERTAQKCLTHFGIFDHDTRNGSMAYIETYLNGLEAKAMPLTEVEAYGIEIHSDRATAYILQNWFNEVETETNQDKAAA